MRKIFADALLRRKPFANNTFKSILIYTITPCLIMILFSFVVFFANIQSRLHSNMELSQTAVETVYRNTEAKMKNISNSLSFYSDDEALLAALRDTSGSPDAVAKMQSVLKTLSEKVDYVDSVIIYNNVSNSFITTDAVMPASDFLAGYTYSDYTNEYWYNYRYSILKQMFLPPTTVRSGSETKLIVPLVFSRLGEKHLNKLIIYNIDFDAILNDTNSILANDDYIIGVINKISKTFYSPHFGNEPMQLSSELSDIFMKNLSYSGLNRFNDERSLIVFSSPTHSLLGYSYFTVMPYSVITRQTSRSAITLILLILAASVLALLLSYKFSKRTFAPIKKLAAELTSGDDIDTIEAINRAVSEIKEKNASLDKIYHNSLTHIQKLYIINLLNAETDTVSSDIGEYFEFEHDYFCSVIYQIMPTEEFTRRYDDADHEEIIKNLSLCIYEEFLGSFDVFMLPAENNVFYFLINSNSPESSGDIAQIAGKINEIVRADSEYIVFAYSVGGVYEGLAGLKRSHKNAMFMLRSNIKPHEPEMPTINLLNSTSQADHIFSRSEKEALINYLTAFKIESAKELINKIINENSQKNLSQDDIAIMYVQIITTITDVLDSKGIAYNDIKGGLSTEQVSELISMPLVELHMMIFKLIDVFKEHLSKYSDNIDMTKIVAYIEKYHTANIGLDTLAAVFNTSAPYLSHVIKSKLGMNFTEYITRMRVQHAIELMHDKNMTINELFPLVGFNNRNAFTNAFKRVTGMTPSEYKKKAGN